MPKFALKIGFSFLFVLGVSPLALAIESTVSEPLPMPKIEAPVATQEPAVKPQAEEVAPVKAVSGKRQASKKISGKKGRKKALGSTQTRLVKKVVVVNGHRKVIYKRVAYFVPDVPSTGDKAGLSRTPDPLDLKSNVALVLDQTNAA